MQKVMYFEQGGYVLLRYKDRLCVPKVEKLQERIMDEDHDLREVYWCINTKKCIVAYFIAKYPNYK